ncbi:hypothetical protein RGU75_06520 [Glaciimonas sp. CA11.2]|uniref:hypothetical protein n=1 Tax=Glaciimonas sp. CA11.2 TaxID=3048601 RepID=UPI002AB4650D|nr:hypothetical protein [Glaciimonas sp. CA11.2]MDY7545886.1 hypothetical protein [Glaciimonas sp. CA11.2]
MDIKNIMSRALLLIGGLCIFLAFCNVFYIAFFIRGPESWFPIEILYSVLLVFLGAIFPIFFIYKKNYISLSRFNELRKKIHEKGYFSNAIWTWIFIFLLLVMNIPGKQSLNPSRLQLLTESNIFYLFCEVLFLSAFWVSTVAICIGYIKKIDYQSK